MSKEIGGKKKIVSTAISIIYLMFDNKYRTYFEVFQINWNYNKPYNLYIDTFEIEGRSFPAGIVIKWSDIKMEREIGQGNFGKVYQGHVNMNEVQR